MFTNRKRQTTTLDEHFATLPNMGGGTVFSGKTSGLYQIQLQPDHWIRATDSQLLHARQDPDVPIRAEVIQISRAHRRA